MATTLHAVIITLGKLLLLLTCATVGSAVVVAVLAAYYSVVLMGGPLSDVPWRTGGDSIVVSLMAAGVGAGLVGLVYLHVLAAYVCIFRKLSDFWGALPRYFCTILVGTLVTSLLYMQLRGPGVPLLETMIIAPPIGFWGTALYVWRRQKRVGSEA